MRAPDALSGTVLTIESPTTVTNSTVCGDDVGTTQTIGPVMLDAADVQQPRYARQCSSMRTVVSFCACAVAATSIKAAASSAPALRIRIMERISYIRTVKPIVAAVPDRSMLRKPTNLLPGVSSGARAAE